MTVRLIALFIGGYLVGSIPFGVIIGRAWSGVDIREFGSRNIGFTNAFRVLGWKPALVVLATDVCKGLVPVLVARHLLTRGGLPNAELWLLPAGLAPIVGHCFSVFLRFRGGRAIATTLGVLLGLAPVAGLCGLGVWLIVVGITRYVSLGSILGAAAVPVTVALTRSRWELTVFWAAIAALVILRHAGNIKRLLAGTESRFGQRTEGEESKGEEAKRRRGDRRPSCHLGEDRMRFREATASDFSHLLPLLRQLWPGQPLAEPRLHAAFCRGIESPDQVYLVAAAENRVIAFGSLSIVNSLWAAGNLGHIHELVVDEGWRRQGLGTRLLDALIEAARARGCRRVELDSAFHREDAHRFYEARGFVRRALWFSRELE